MVLTRALKSTRNADKIFSLRDKAQWALLLFCATAAPVSGLYYLFTAGGAAATDAAIAGRVDGRSRVNDLSALDPPRQDLTRITTL